MAGGDPLSGSSDRRGDVDEPDGPLEAGRQGESIEAIGRVIDEAGRDLRDGTVDEGLLKDLGMTRDQFAAFVEKYRRRIGQVRAMRERTERPGQTVDGAVIPGSDRRQAGRGAGGDVDGRGGEDLSKDELRKLYEERARKVSPEYREQVEAYFRAVSEAADGDDE